MQQKKQQKKKNVGRKKNRSLTLMALPAALFIFVFNYLPLGGLIIAFKDYRYDKGLIGSEWCGFENFAFFFRTYDAWTVLRNTIVLNLLFIFMTLVVSLAVALMLNEIQSRTAIKAVQTIMFFPYFMSWVVVGYLLYAYLNRDMGIVNQVLLALGLHDVSWYTSADYWPFILTFMYVWKMAGYYSVVYYAGLMGVERSYYEAALLDGANRWQLIWHISLPMIRSIIICMVLLQLGRVMYADFGLFFQLTRDQGMLYSTTDVLDTYIYRSLRVLGDIGISTAVSCFQAVVGFLLVFVSNLIVRKIDRESALF